jgi:hypothetical protein
VRRTVFLAGLVAAGLVIGAGGYQAVAATANRPRRDVGNGDQRPPARRRRTGLRWPTSPAPPAGSAWQSETGSAATGVLAFYVNFSGCENVSTLERRKLFAIGKIYGTRSGE